MTTFRKTLLAACAVVSIGGLGCRGTASEAQRGDVTQAQERGYGGSGVEEDDEAEAKAESWKEKKKAKASKEKAKAEEKMDERGIGGSGEEEPDSSSRGFFERREERRAERQRAAQQQQQQIENDVAPVSTVPDGAPNNTYSSGPDRSGEMNVSKLK